MQSQPNRKNLLSFSRHRFEISSVAWWIWRCLSRKKNITLQNRHSYFLPDITVIRRIPLEFSPTRCFSFFKRSFTRLKTTVSFSALQHPEFLVNTYSLPLLLKILNCKHKYGNKCTTFLIVKELQSTGKGNGGVTAWTVLLRGLTCLR